MGKVRTGIEIPIIPEDFDVTEENPRADMPEPLLIRVTRKSPDGLDPEDWVSIKILFDRYPKNEP
jgi:hypothetical protein